METKILVNGKDVDFTKFEYSTLDLQKFRIEFNKITSFLNREISEKNFQSLVDSFVFLVHYIPLPVFSINKNYLLRGRANYKGEVFNEEADISYNTKNLNAIKDFGRFNQPYESMFYGAVPLSDQKRLIVTVCIECCKEIEDENNTCREQYFTFGKWYLNEHIPVLNLCFNERCLETNPAIKANIEIFRKDLQENMSSDVKTFIQEYWAFLTDLACIRCSTPQQHFISTAFISTIKEYYGNQFNGIIYPSSMTEMEGVNIVLTPKAVDKYLKLKQTFMYKLIRTPNNPKDFHGGECSNVANVIDKKFVFTLIR